MWGVTCIVNSYRSPDPSPAADGSSRDIQQQGRFRPSGRGALTNRSPRALDGIGDVFAVGRGEAQADAQVGQLGMRVMPAVKFGDRFGVAFPGLGLHQHALLEMRFELTLQRDEERRSVVAVPVGEAAGYDLGVVDLHLHLRVA